MLNKVFRSANDLYNLSLKKTVSMKKGVNLDYRKVVVNKPWGYEYLMFENEFVAIWILFLKKDQSTSIHCHPRKRTSLLVLSGNVCSSTLDTSFNLKELDGLMIENGVFHSTKAQSPEGALIMEVETPPDKNDLLRLKDNYGREDKNYEGEKHMSHDFKKYEYCDFFRSGIPEKFDETRSVKNRRIRIIRDEVAKIVERTDCLNDSLFCFLDDGIIDNFVMNVGDLVDKKSLREISRKNEKTKCCLMLIS